MTPDEHNPEGEDYAARGLAEKVVTRIEGTFRDWLMAGERTKAIEEVAAVLAPVVARLKEAEGLASAISKSQDNWIAKCAEEVARAARREDKP